MRAAAVATLVTLQSLIAVSDGTEFGCRNNLIADQWREKVLKVHNDLRRRLAEGNQLGKTKALPVAKNMNELIWDCSIEDAAYEKALKCTSPVTPPANHGAVSSMITAKANSCNPTEHAQQALRDIWNAGAAKQTDQAKVAGNEDFSQLAYYKTNGVGCSYNWCTGKLFLVCLYNQDGAAAQNLYTNGDPGDTCKACEPGGNQDNCVNGLCQVPLETVVPTSTICPNANAGDAKFITDDLRNIALDMHNYYRRLLATGWAKDKQLGYAKPAAAMPKLEYDCDIEDKIMTGLKQCDGKIITTFPTAQADSYKKFTPFDITREEALETVIKQWWSPLADTGIPDNTYLDSMLGTDLQHYVNMAFDKTTKVGCGIEVCQAKGWIEIQCGYVTDNLDDGTEIYQTGKTCSKCGKLSPVRKCSPLGGLCIT